jgi:hypothetical protein
LDGEQRHRLMLMKLESKSRRHPKNPRKLSFSACTGWMNGFNTSRVERL